MDNQLHNQLMSEIKAINRTFQAFGIKARTAPGLTGVGGDQLVIYKLQTAPGQALGEIDRRLPEISEAISERRRQGTLVRFLRRPVRLEVTHPQSRPLIMAGMPAGETHAMLLGRTYDDGARDLWVRFDDSPHVLVAGGTGAGKSVSMANMLLSLCWHTSPAELQITLIDMKATDLVPFARLPHVVAFATDGAPARDVMQDAEALRLSRQGQIEPLPRRLVVVDEYTDLVSDRSTMEAVHMIAQKGRSANVNLLIATQHPTAKALGGPTIKNNFLTRCIGRVADANAASTAAGRPGTHAELLPGKGAFMLVRDFDPIRYQSYLLTHVDIESAITRIGRKWRSTSTTTAQIAVPTRVVEASRSVVEASSRTPVVEPAADEIDQIAAVIAPMLADGASKNAMCKAALGRPYAGSYAGKIDAAIERVEGQAKIIKLRRAS